MGAQINCICQFSAPGIERLKSKTRWVLSSVRKNLHTILPKASAVFWHSEVRVLKNDVLAKNSVPADSNTGAMKGKAK